MRELIESRKVELQVLRRNAEIGRLFIFRYPASLLKSYMTEENLDCYMEFLEKVGEDAEVEMISFGDLAWNKTSSHDIEVVSRYQILVVTTKVGEKWIGLIDFFKVKKYWIQKEKDGYFKVHYGAGINGGNRKYMSPCYLGDLTRPLKFYDLQCDKYLGGLTEGLLSLLVKGDEVCKEKLKGIIDGCLIEELNSALVGIVEKLKEPFDEDYFKTEKWWRCDEESYKRLDEDPMYRKYSGRINSGRCNKEGDGKKHYYLDIELLTDEDVIVHQKNSSYPGKYMLSKEFSIDIRCFLEKLNERGWLTDDIVAMADMLIGEEITVFMTHLGISSSDHGQEGKTYTCRMGYEIPDIAIERDTKIEYLRFSSNSDYENSKGIPATKQV